jgi:hypothetical protein
LGNKSSGQRARARRERYTVTFERAPTAPPPPPPAPPARRAAPPVNPFTAAYAGPEIGPIGATWPADVTGYAKYMKWALPLNNAGSRAVMRNHPNI